MACQSLHIAILATENPYNSTVHFAKGLAKALQRLGVRVDFYSFKPDSFYKVHYALLDNPPQLTLSFSDIRMGNISLGELSHTPHLTCLIDPALYFRHHFQGPFSLVTTVDRKDLHYIKSTSFPQALFLPHAVDSEVVNEKEEKKLFDIIMVGTCYDIEKIFRKWKKTFSPHLVELLLDAAEAVLSPKGISCLEALQSRGVEEAMLVPLHGELDLYIEGKERLALLHALKGLPIHIWGKGPWKKYLPEATVHKPVAFSKVPHLLRQSLLVINATPRFKDGSHERVFYSLACNALPLAGATPFLKESFSNEEMLFYDYGRYEGVREKVEEALKNPQVTKRIVEQGKARVAQGHTWDARAPSLIKFILNFFSKVAKNPH